MLHQDESLHFYRIFPRVRTHKRVLTGQGKANRGLAKMELIREEAFERIRLYFPKSRGKARVDDRRVISGIVTYLATG
jgi:hypothetical protein